jgi:predicted porin
MKATSRFAIAAAAGLFASNAMAADLGGNCCADLEERVAELEATAARKGNRKVSLTVYGQVNQSIVWHDDEFGYREGKLTVRDNDAAMSRFGFRGDAKIRPDLSAGYVIEIGFGSTDFGTSGSNLTIRHNYLYLKSDRLGRVNLGQTSQVTDGLYEINLANALVTPGGMDEAGQVLNPIHALVFSTPFDGSRKQGVYYSTPTIAGFVISAGWSHDTQSGQAKLSDPLLGNDANDHWEVALRYAGEFNGVRLAAGIGYRATEANTAPSLDKIRNWDNDTILGSASVMHTPTGLFLSGGYATTQYDTPIGDVDNDGWWLMTGVERNFFGPGATTLFAEYSEVSHDNSVLPLDLLDGRYWGLGAVQKIDAAAMDLYINFRNYDLTEIGHDANVVVGGAIIRF